MSKDENTNLLLEINCDHSPRDSLEVIYVTEQLGIYSSKKFIAISVREGGRSNSIYLELGGRSLEKLTEILYNLKANLLILKK